MGCQEERRTKSPSRGQKLSLPSGTRGRSCCSAHRKSLLCTCTSVLLLQKLRRKPQMDGRVQPFVQHDGPTGTGPTGKGLITLAPVCDPRHLGDSRSSQGRRSIESIGLWRKLYEHDLPPKSRSGQRPAADRLAHAPHLASFPTSTPARQSGLSAKSRRTADLVPSIGHRGGYRMHMTAARASGTVTAATLITGSQQQNETSRLPPTH